MMDAHEQDRMSISREFFECTRAASSELSRFRASLEELFREQSLYKAFSKQPTVGLRLTPLGEPPGLLVCRPRWCKRTRTIDPAHIDAELSCYKLWRGRMEFRVELGLWLVDQAVGYSRITVSDGSGIVATKRGIETIRAFLERPGEVFARSHDKCCLCGKPLTDAKSMGRGIGPECFSRSEWLRRLYGSPELALV
jgi:hypothetical protein